MPKITKRRALLVLAPVAAAVATLNIPGAEGSSRASALLRDANGARAGRMELVARNSGAIVVAQVNLPASAAGFHGFHIHTTGQCDPAAVDPATGAPSPFFSAGGHLGSVEGQSHAGHAGDMPSLLVQADGSAVLSFQTDRVMLDQIFDDDGAAVIVHQNPDNFANIPTRYSPTGPDEATLRTGDSGGRLLCGVLR